MTIRHIRVFVSVYELMNMTRAATMLHMTQPAVTRMIKEMENHYGVLFFERINHRLYATEAGKRFYVHGKRIINEFDVMESDTRAGAERFNVRIGATYYLGSFLLPEVMNDFKHRFPLAELRAKVMNLNNIQNALCANELDFAIMEDRPDDIRLRSEVFYQDRLVLVMPNTHELSQREHLSVRDIQGQRVLLRESGSNNRRLQEEIFERNAISIDPVFESYSTEAILSAVSQGIGISLVPEYLARTWIHSGLLVSKPLVDEPMARKNYIVWHREKHLTPQIHETMKICHRVVMRLCERKEEQV